MAKGSRALQGTPKRKAALPERRRGGEEEEVVEEKKETGEGQQPPRCLRGRARGAPKGRAAAAVLPGYVGKPLHRQTRPFQCVRHEKIIPGAEVKPRRPGERG